jgi:ATP-binding cassette subfamily B protein RaxB
MVAAFYAVPQVLIKRHLLDSNHFALQGMNAAQMMQQARQVGLTGQVRQLPLSQITQLKQPVILWWNRSHFVVLRRSCSRSRQAEILDPTRGRLLLSWSQLQLCYSGVGILLAPEPAAPSSTLF